MKAIVRLVMLLGIMVLGSGITSAAGKQVLFRDDFDTGFSVDSPAANWFYFGIPGAFAGDDGVATTSNTGLRVVSAGTNPSTGKPAFTKTLGQEGAADNPLFLPGGIDHVKWLVYTNRLASTGIPGYDAVPGEELTGSVSMSAQTFGTEFHPFGNAVKDANGDMRLAAVAFNAIDFETYVVADFFMTNDRLYALYERLPFGWTETNRYAAFTFVIPLQKRKPTDSHDLQIAYDREAGVIRWLVDGKEKFRVDKIGYRIDRKYMTIDHGGVEELVEPRQLNFGMGMFTLLDAHLPSGEGLVKLSTAPDFYFDPEVGEPTPQTFVDNLSEPGSRIFGQGAELRIKYFEVETHQAGGKGI